MKQLVEIDSTTEMGKEMLALLHALSTISKSIVFVSEEEHEAKEEDKNHKNGKGNNGRAFRFLGRKE